VAVLEEVLKDQGHRECEDIYLALRQKGSHVSRATIYRTMDILVKNDFARKMEIGDGRARYESKVDSPHHDHIVCTSCGKIMEFVDQDVEDLQNKIAKRYHFKLQRHIHHLFGICKECQ
jgi:Fur family ferric uptake transcriptional regulator